MTIMKLNLGCGKDYRNGWINVDFNKKVRADIHCDFEKKLPFGDNSIDYVLMDNVLEHISNFLNFLEELHRICKPNAVIEIYVPHYSGMYALQHPTHYKYFGVNTFSTFTPEERFNGEFYCKAQFKILKTKLLFFHHNLIRAKFLSKLPINFLFNGGWTWQMLMERFQFFGFDEIYYKLQVIK